MSIDKENKKTSEELAEEAAIQQAMMADLGIGRLDELPVDDGELAAMNKKKGGGKNGRHGRGDRGDREPRQEYIRRPQIQNDALVARGAKMSNVWQDAIASGVFEDDDAAAVKGLADLGGPRLHELKAEAKRKATALLKYQESQSRNNLHPYATRSQMPPAQEPHHSFAHVQQMVKSGSPFVSNRSRKQKMSSSRNAGPSRLPSAPVHLRQPSESAPLRQPVSSPLPGPSRIVQQAPRDVPVLPSQYGGNQHVANPLHMVARAEVLLNPPGRNQPLPAIVFLTVAPAPTLGFCMMFAENKLFVQFTIAEYQDFVSSDLTLSLHFGQNVLYFGLTFSTAGELESFLKVLRDLKAGKYAVGAFETSGQKPAPEPSVAPKPSIATQPPVTPANAAPANENTTVIRLPPVKPQASVSNNRAVQYASRFITGEASGTRQHDDESELKATQGVLINVEGKDTSPVQKRGSSEASALLSTLEPYGNEDALEVAPAVTSLGHDISRTSTPVENDALTHEPVRLSVPDAVAMLRNMLTAFLRKKAGGKTKREITATVEGIREAFIDVVCQDHTKSERQEVVAQIEDYLNSSAVAFVKPRRFQYTNEEMMAMKDSQVQPPAWLADVPYPHGKDGAPTPPDDGVDTKEYIRKSTIGMDWVLGKAESSAATTQKQPMTIVKTESSVAVENISPQASAAALKPVQAPVKPMAEYRKLDAGLGASRWSSTMDAPLQNSNAFTGLPYEKRWKEDSYFHDLAQLDPETRIDEAENLEDFFFPGSRAVGDRPGALATLQPSARDLGSDTQVGDLDRRMSRLTLESPAGPRATSCSTVRIDAFEQGSQLIPIEEPTPPLNTAARTFTPTARAFAPAVATPPPANTRRSSSASTLRGLGASRHASRAALPTAGRFNFHLPK
ncbi:hypothetical protein QC762_209830 [Podospora pseudocomata]|uniref:Uncharacterized protein n=1 Tax=Podospora pseudocomata TaxID=2093779 RepID=A0ABR0GN48_9PEZI|nr:hypothetical protein QC762_209830 [Podospora pseudocomata]